MDLTPLLSPRSVAVIGASQKGGRATGAVRNLLELGFKGGIYPVNPKYETVLELPCYPSLAAIPGPVDLVAIGIPSEQIAPLLEEAHQKGVRAAVILASGYGEAGPAGRERQAALEAFARRTGMLICGPNCLGMINFHERSAGYTSTSPKDVATGDVALVSQSGTVVVALIRSLRGIAFSHMVSSGNEAVVTSADYLRFLAGDPRVKVLAAFIEGIKRPAAFVAAAEAARTAGKPLILVKTGRSELGGAASAAHTGSLAGSAAVQRALFRQKAIVQCDDLDEWLEAIELFRLAKPPQGRGIGLIGVSGGQNALVLDHAAELGLEVPPLSAAGREKLAALLPWYARPENPIDPTGAIGDDLSIYRRCLEILAAEPAIGLVAVSQDSPAHFDLPVSQLTAEVARQSAKPFVFFSNISGPYRPEVPAILRAAGVPYLQGIRESLKAIKSLFDYHASRAAPARPARRDAARRSSALAILGNSGPMVSEEAAKSLLALYGFPVVRETRATTPAAALAAAAAIGYPVAAKVVSPDIAHKAAIGGVRLDIASSAALEEAYAGIHKDVAARAPKARIQGILVQPMVARGVEVILGLKRDPQFGATLVFGLGGVFVEAIRQVALRVAPIGEADARGMIGEVAALGRILAKAAPGFDPAPLLVPLLLGLSDLAGELGEEIEELDVNPLILDPAAGRATAVDALILRRAAASAEAPPPRDR